jgi:hypothetical protein
VMAIEAPPEVSAVASTAVLGSMWRQIPIVIPAKGWFSRAPSQAPAEAACGRAPNRCAPRRQPSSIFDEKVRPKRSMTSTATEPPDGRA